MENLKNVTCRGPVSGSNLRVVYDDEHVVVVSSQNTTYLTRDGEAIQSRGGRWTIPTTDGELVVVKQGGCACGKPWLSKPSSMDLLASVPTG
jgi:hypothetical protein